PDAGLAPRAPASRYPGLGAPDAGVASPPDAGVATPADAGVAAAAGEREPPDAGAPLDAGSGQDAGVRFAGALDGNAKPIQLPPSDARRRMLEAWKARLKALEARSFRTAEEQETRLAMLREELGFENLFTVGGAIAFEAQTLMEVDPIEAKRRALLAASLAPDLPYAHWMVARTAWNEDLLNFGQYVGATVRAIETTFSEPRWRATLVADAAVALICALLAAAGLVVLLVFARHARYFLHDFRHLLPVGASSLQSALLAALVVLLPCALGLGVFGALAALALCAWTYMTRSERIVCGVLIALLGMIPSVAHEAARQATFMGTRAETVYLVERGGFEGEATEAKLAAIGEQGSAPFAVTFALGRQARRRGEVQLAIERLRRAAEQRPRSAEALLELGNALFLFGDLDGARETYERASERAPKQAQAYFNLARLYGRRGQMVAREDASAELTKAQEFVRKTISIDPKLGMAASGEVDYRANRYLAPMPLAMESLLEMVDAEARPAEIEHEVAVALFGRLPVSLIPVTALVSVGLLALFGILGGALRFSTPCTKCGRPVCRRCDREVVGPGLCGQCVYVFNQRGVVDPTARAEKELGIQRYQRRRVRVVKVASVLLAGAGQVLLGRTVRGALIILLVALLVFPIVFAAGVVEVPLGRAPAVLKTVSAGLAIALLWALGAKGTFKAFKSPASPKASPTAPQS
ncbi:MAG: tetratricopeptide repeat protein, partial [Myxococcales bacterium]